MYFISDVLHNDTESLHHTADFYRCFQFKEDGLIDEDLSRFGAKETDFMFSELNLLSGATSAHCVN